MAVNKSSIRSELKRCGLSAHEDVVLGALEPAVRMITGKPVKKGLPVGSSKFGGEPDLPASADWPMHSSGWPMHFLGQVCLSDLPKGHLPNGLLPAKGWLWFWWDQLGRWLEWNTRLPSDSGDDAFLITFESDPRVKLARRAFPDFPEPKIPKAKKLRTYEPPKFDADPEVPILFKPVTSVTQAARQQLFKQAERDDPDKGWTRAHKFYQAIHLDDGRQAKHRLLGDCFENEDPPKKPWRLLALIDSDFEKLGWMWGDGGELQFWIREQDLAKRNFSKVKAIAGSA